MTAHRLRLVTLAALGVSLAACPTVPEECRANVDCPSGEGCRENLCVVIEDGQPDAGVPPSGDAGPGEPDAGPGEIDAGPDEIDAGPDEIDAGPDEIDAGPDETDAGPDEIDDAGTGDDDAGTTIGDAGDAGD